MDEDIFYLDLNQVTLLGFERQNLFSKVEKMVQAIEAGDNNFPPVPVKRFDYFTYALTHEPDKIGNADGGHHRAVAHYIANKPLKCRLVEENIRWRNYPKRDEWGFSLFPIPEAILIDKYPPMPKDKYLAYIIYCLDE